MVPIGYILALLLFVLLIAMFGMIGFVLYLWLRRKMRSKKLLGGLTIGTGALPTPPPTFYKEVAVRSLPTATSEIAQLAQQYYMQQQPIPTPLPTAQQQVPPTTVPSVPPLQPPPVALQFVARQAPRLLTSPIYQLSTQDARARFIDMMSRIPPPALHEGIAQLMLRGTIVGMDSKRRVAYVVRREDEPFINPLPYALYKYFQLYKSGGGGEEGKS